MILLDNLIPNKYYSCLALDHTYYFKFKNYDNDGVYCSGFQVVKDNRTCEIIYDDFSEDFSTLKWFESCFVIEIDPYIIVDYLPDDLLEKKYIIRQKRIESLLKI